MLIIRRIDRVISRFYHDTLPFRMICWRRDLVSRWFHVPPHCHSSSSLLPSNSKHHHDHHHCTTGSSCLCFISIPTQHLRWRRAKPRVPALRRQSPPSSRARQPSAFQPPPPGSWSITPVLSCLSCPVCRACVRMLEVIWPDRRTLPRRIWMMNAVSLTQSHGQWP